MILLRHDGESFAGHDGLSAMLAFVMLVIIPLDLRRRHACSLRHCVVSRSGGDLARQAH